MQQYFNLELCHVVTTVVVFKHNNRCKNLVLIVRLISNMAICDVHLGYGAVCSYVTLMSVHMFRQNFVRIVYVINYYIHVSSVSLFVMPEIG